MADVREGTQVFVITGFLESGKTSFIDYTIRQDYFQTEGTTVLLVCEQGEKEYDPEILKEYNTVVVNVENKEDLTLDFLRGIEFQYKPERVMIEYNPLWSVKELWERKLPRGWAIEQQVVMIDASTYDVYSKNMKSLFVEMSQRADMMVFNRATQDMPLASYRRGVKVVNPGCDVVFEREDGELIDIFESGVPYDMDADPIVIDDVDFGIFFIDLRDDPDSYIGKRVTFRGKALKSRSKDNAYFVPARQAMTCCAEDIQYIGYLCKVPEGGKWKANQWYQVTATVAMERNEAYRGQGIVFHAESMQETDPPAVELVYFS